MIVYKIDKQGGFTAGDTDLGITAYAYPTSPRADMAKRSAQWAKTEAEDMMRNERASLKITLGTRADYDARNWLKLNAA